MTICCREFTRLVPQAEIVQYSHWTIRTTGQHVKRIDLVIDVSGPGSAPGTLQSVVSVYTPNRISTENPTVLFAFPGGSATRHYFDIHLETTTGFRQVEHHVDHGLVVVTVDYLGTGESVFPNLDLLDLEVVGRAAHSTVRNVLEFLAQDNELTIGPLVNPNVVGMGHSLGGMLLTVVQAWHETFDAVVLLGWSSIQAVLPQPNVDTRQWAQMSTPRGTDFRTARALAAKRPAWAVGPHGHGLWHHHFWDDLPPEVAEIDRPATASAQGRQTADKFTLPSWRSVTTPPFVLWGLSKGVVAEEARVIAVPVLIANGEIDTCRNPYAETSSYSHSPCVTTVVIDRMAHMHNFAATRERLWNRIVAWIPFVLSQPRVV